VSQLHRTVVIFLTYAYYTGLEDFSGFQNQNLKKRQDILGLLIFSTFLAFPLKEHFTHFNIFIEIGSLRHNKQEVKHLNAYFSHLWGK